jgi:hypothetical protein
MTASHPEPTPGADTSVRFTYYRKTNNKLSVVSIIVEKMMLSPIPASSRRVGSRASCFWMTSRSDSIAAKIGAPDPLDATQGCVCLRRLGRRRASRPAHWLGRASLRYSKKSNAAHIARPKKIRLCEIVHTADRSTCRPMPAHACRGGLYVYRSLRVEITRRNRPACPRRPIAAGMARSATLSGPCWG